MLTVKFPPLARKLTRFRIVLLAAMLAAVGSCGGNEITVFPPGLEPLERNTASFPAGRPENQYPEELNLVSGEVPGMYFWTHARGYINVPVARAWEALREPDVCVDRRQITEWMVTRDVEPGYDYSFRLHDIVRNVITIDFDMTWRSSSVEAGDGGPLSVALRFSKTAGSTFITLSTAFILARHVNANTTSFDMVYHIKAFAQDVARTEAFVRDYFASAVAFAHGRPLPTYR